MVQGRFGPKKLSALRHRANLVSGLTIDNNPLSLNQI
ncbi:MAG: hypothetical protein Ct9H90mP5_11060 [Acidimicrobiaceae bacterium]|nr:MAG: hypothetical protein Ct9H90mP5_11060 [Acidimicrobiaceae bacterium]